MIKRLNREKLNLLRVLSNDHAFKPISETFLYNPVITCCAPPPHVGYGVRLYDG